MIKTIQTNINLLLLEDLHGDFKPSLFVQIIKFLIALLKDFLMRITDLENKFMNRVVCKDKLVSNYSSHFYFNFKVY